MKIDFSSLCSAVTFITNHSARNHKRKYERESLMIGYKESQPESRAYRKKEVYFPAVTQIIL